MPTPTPPNPLRPKRSFSPRNASASPAAARAEHSDEIPPPPLGDAPRHAAIRALSRQARQFPEFDLLALDRALERAQPDPDVPDAPKLDGRDIAFAHALYDAAARRWLTLEFLLQRSLTQSFPLLEPRLRAVLLAGAAQIIFLDRVPAHAAINHAVQWAKTIIRPGAGSMVNAVLRKLAALRPATTAGAAAGTPARRERYTSQRDELPASDGSAIVLAEPVLPDNQLDRLSIATSHPLALLEDWLREMPMREVERIALHSLVDPPVILNTTYLKSPLPPSVPVEPHSVPGHHVFTGTHVQLSALVNRRSDLWVQDPASSAAIANIADLAPAPELILDLCAGQGTKTTQLAAAFPNARIVATDIDAARFEVLAHVFKDSAQVRVETPDQIRETCLAQADLILLDVPCSNTGVLARRPEARYRFDVPHVQSLVDTQRQIIADCIPLLRENPRGRILYSTCSLQPEENRQIAGTGGWAAKWHSFKPARESAAAPEGVPGDPPHKYRDGSYSVLLQ